MRKLNLLFTLILLLGGVSSTFAQNYSITGPNILKEWTVENSSRWNEWGSGIYDYANNPTTATNLISPMITGTKNGQRITVSGYNNGGSSSEFRVYYSTDKTNWTLAKNLDSEMNATDNKVVDFVAEFEVEGSYYIKLECLKVYIVNVKAEDADRKTVYLNAAKWNAADAVERYALYTKNEASGAEVWMDFTSVDREYDTYRAEVPVGVGLIIPARMNGNTTENNWDNKWNQTTDITTINDNALYTITNINGTWDGKSTYTESTFTPSTYTMSAEDVSFGTIYMATENTFTLKNTGTGILKNITIENSNEAVFTLSDVPTELAAGASASIKVTMAEVEGENSATLTVKATWADDITANVSGAYVIKPMTIYLNPNGIWNTDGARFALYKYNNTTNVNTWADFVAVAGEEEIYSAEVPSNLEGIVLVRMNGSTTENSWNTMWNQTADILIENVYDKALYTITSINGAAEGKSAYETSTFTPTVADTWEETFDYTSDSNYNFDYTLLTDKGWELDNGFKIYNGNMYYWATGSETRSFVTPKLYVKGTSDVLKMGAYGNGVNGENNVKIYYSKDKTSWTRFQEIEYYSVSKDYTTKEHEISGVPEGNWYLKFEVCDVAIDYLKGFTQKLSTLAASENETAFAGIDKVADVTMERTVLEGPNPMCLPFDVTKDEFQRVFGEEATVLEFTGYEDGAINLTKKELGDVAMTANVPYIVYAKQAATEVMFYNAAVNTNAAGMVEQGEAKFIGTFVKKPLYTENDLKPYAVSKSATINPVKEGANLKGFRAYFMLPANTTAKVFIDGVATDGETTGIESIMDSQADGNVFDLNGRKVNRTAKGIYIQNGRKFVVK